MRKIIFTFITIFILASSQINAAGFSGYSGYTSGELGAKIGCLILAILKIPGCGSNNGYSKG